MKQFPETILNFISWFSTKTWANINWICWKHLVKYMVKFSMNKSPWIQEKSGMLLVAPAIFMGTIRAAKLTKLWTALHRIWSPINNPMNDYAIWFWWRHLSDDGREDVVLISFCEIIRANEQYCIYITIKDNWKKTKKNRVSRAQNCKRKIDT